MRWPLISMAIMGLKRAATEKGADADPLAAECGRVAAGRFLGLPSVLRGVISPLLNGECERPELNRRSLYRIPHCAGSVNGWFSRYGNHLKP